LTLRPFDRLRAIGLRANGLRAIELRAIGLRISSFALVASPFVLPSTSSG